MDDLISRKAAVSRISDLLILELKGQRIPTWNEVYNAIGDIAPVPAVPLDMLCDWLAENASLPVGEYMISAMAWRRKLKKWMEEDNATDPK